jgi:hypothetical protein
MVVITFGTLLPFLVLSWANKLFRERLKALFQLGDKRGHSAFSAVLPPTRDVEAARPTK